MSTFLTIVATALVTLIVAGVIATVWFYRIYMK